MRGWPAVSPGRIGASLALLLFGVLAIGSGFDRMSRGTPALARFVPAPMQAQAARATAAQALIREQPAAGLASARRAVAADPVEPASTALLGTAYLVNRQPEEAEAVFRIAARFGWREPTVQAYWYEAALQSGDLPRAVDRADALLRTHPTLPSFDLVLGPLEGTAQGRAALIVRMAGRPNWLTTYLHPDGTVDDAVVARRSLVLAELAAAGTRLGCAKVAPFVAQALARGARGDAERVWNGHCPGARVGPGLVDGGFEGFGRDEASPFGWRAGFSGDVSVRAAGSRDRSVMLRNRASVSRLVLRQAVSLAPGLYRLRGATVPGRLVASLGCGAEPPLPSQVSGDVAGAGQVLRVPQCSRLELGLWLRPGGDEIELDAVVLDKVG